MSRRGSLSCPQTSPPSSTSKIKIITRLKFTASPNETASKDYKPNGNTSRGRQPRAKHSKPEQHWVHCNNFRELAMLINNQTMQRRVPFFPPLYSRASTCSPWAGPSSAPKRTAVNQDHQDSRPSSPAGRPAVHYVLLSFCRCRGRSPRDKRRRRRRGGRPQASRPVAGARTHALHELRAGGR